MMIHVHLVDDETVTIEPDGDATTDDLIALAKEAIGADARIRGPVGGTDGRAFVVIPSRSIRYITLSGLDPEATS